MTVATSVGIPADHIAFTNDGHAWRVFSGNGTDHPPANVFVLDRQCDTCGSGQEVRTGAGYTADWIPCGCIGGRHTFGIRVACPDPKCPDCTTGGPMCRLRVSVVPGMVLPIAYQSADAFIGPTIGGEDYWLYSPTAHPKLITLPPAAKVGMWAVKLRVA